MHWDNGVVPYAFDSNISKSHWQLSNWAGLNSLVNVTLSVYEISNVYVSVDSATRTEFQAAIAEYNKYTCIEWKLRTNEADYVLVKDEGTNSGCYSYVGKTGGSQTLNLQQPNCVHVSSLMVWRVTTE